MPWKLALNEKQKVAAAHMPPQFVVVDGVPHAILMTYLTSNHDTHPRGASFELVPFSNVKNEGDEREGSDHA